MAKPYEIIKTLLQANIYAIKNKRLNLEIIIDHKQKDGINVRHSLYNSSKLTSNSKQLQKFLKNAYQNAVAEKKSHIPWEITATLNLPKFQIVETTLLDSIKATEVINDLKEKIIKEGITVKNDETNFAVNLSLQELFENFHIQNSTLSKLLNDCLKVKNNFEEVKKESNLVSNHEHPTYHHHSVQL